MVPSLPTPTRRSAVIPRLFWGLVSFEFSHHELPASLACNSRQMKFDSTNYLTTDKMFH